MAASLRPSNKVKSRKYTNWIKLTLALLYQKLGIHGFIKNEVSIMHEKLKKNIYKERQPKRCWHCKSADIRWKDGMFKLENNCPLDCGRWLQELQELFPSNIDQSRVYWNNSFISEWPFKPWECAKIYLPRGQQRSNTGPDKSDSQALMTLFINCAHFRRQLSKNGLHFARDISRIRDTVMHSPELEVADEDVHNSIRQIINFLQDPVFADISECKIAIANVQEIWKADYKIVLEDENKAKLFHLEEQLCSIRKKMADRDETFDSRFLVLETNIQSLKDLFEASDSSEEVQKNIEENIDQALAEWNATMKEHEERIATLEIGLDEVEGKVDYLLNKDPEYRERESAKKYFEELKSKAGWDPQSDDAVKELVKSAQEGKLFQCKLLIHEHVKMSMKELPDVVNGANVTLKILTFIIQHLKNIKSWDYTSKCASVALDIAFAKRKMDLFDNLHFEGVQTAEESD